MSFEDANTEPNEPEQMQTGAAINWREMEDAAKQLEQRIPGMSPEQARAAEAVLAALDKFKGDYARLITAADRIALLYPHWRGTFSDWIQYEGEGEDESDDDDQEPTVEVPERQVYLSSVRRTWKQWLLQVFSR